MDSEYLRGAVGTVLAKGIAETVMERPEDPIAYLADYLLKSVADEKADKELTDAKKADSAATEAATAKAAEEKTKAEEKAAAQATQVEKEDARLDLLLSGATSADEVFMAVLSYGRARTGASGYVMLTDLPEKVMPKKEPEAPPAEAPAEAPAEGEEAPAEPPAEEAEPEEPRPPFKPMSIEYVAATSSDEALLIGKALPRPAEASEEDENPPPKGVGEGVTFTAIDDFIAGGAKVFHEPKAVENRSVKFFYMPRLGAYACAPFADYEGDVCGVLGFDTLGLERAFSAAELAMLESLAGRMGETLTRIEEGLVEKHYAMLEVLSAAYPKDAESGAFPTFTPEEGADEIESGKSALALPAAALAPLTADALKHLETRRSLPPAVLLALKGVLALTSPAMAAELPEATWDGIKEGFAVGEILWGAELFAALGAFDVMDGAGGDGWAVASDMAAQLSTPPEEGEVPMAGLAADANLLLGKVLCDWLLAAVALHDKKVAKEEAEAAAAAAEAAPPEEEAQE